MSISRFFLLQRWLRAQLSNATGILILTTVGSLLVRMVSSVTLTRLLTPETFGLVGIIASIFFAIASLADLGFQSHVLRHPRGDEAHFQNVIWTLHFIRGIVLSVVAMFCAPAVAWVIDKPEITWPLAIASLTFAIDGSVSLSLITILRSNHSRSLSFLDFGVTAFQTAVSIALAIALRNVWAIVGGMILACCFRTFVSYRISKQLHTIAWDSGLRREFWAFSRLVMASGFVTLLISQTDKFVLARLLTLAEFGFYATASTLASAPQAIASAYMQRILYPLYAQTFRDRPEQLSDIYYSAGHSMKRLYWLGGGALIGGGSLIVRILYDPRYLSAGPFLSILAVSTLLAMTNKASSALMLAQGDTRFTLVTNIVRLVWLVAVIPPAYYFFGAFGIIAACGFMEIPVYVYSSFILAKQKTFRIFNEIPYFLYAFAGAALAAVISSAAHVFAGV